MVVKGKLPKVGNSGDSRPALIEHYQSPLLHYAWNLTHCVGEVCNDRVPEVPPCCGTPQSTKDVPCKQSTNVNMRNEITVKHYQKGTIEHILHLKIQIKKLIKIHFKYCYSINMAKFNTTDLLKNHSPPVEACSKTGVLKVASSLQQIK